MTPSPPDPAPATPAEVARADQKAAAERATRALAARIEQNEDAVLFAGHTGPAVGRLFHALGVARRLAVCTHLAACTVQPGVTAALGAVVCADCYLSATAETAIDQGIDCPWCKRPASLPTRGPLRPGIATFGLVIGRVVLCGACISREHFHLTWQAT